jgi:hypothetical protein
MQPENPLPQPSRGPTGIVPPGTPEQNPNVVKPQIDMPPQQPATHMEPLPASKRRRSAIALISLIAIIAAAIALFVFLF